jgi:hypothetical protein
MHNFFCQLRRVLPLAVIAGVVALVPPTAVAAPVTANLRVEAAGKALDPGTKYGTDTTKFKTDKRAPCGGSGATKTLPGPTAMGILGTAAVKNKTLRPVGISDKFSFGLTVCGIGSYVGFESTSYWLYKVNHKSPEVGADQYRLKAGDQVLWFFQNTATGSNTGNELVTSAPSRATTAKPFTVTVWSYDANGKRKPAAGARVGGKLTGATGKVRLTVSRARTLRLRATRAKDIAAAPVAVRVVSPS